MCSDFSRYELQVYRKSTDTQVSRKKKKNLKTHIHKKRLAIYEYGGHLTKQLYVDFFLICFVFNC